MERGVRKIIHEELYALIVEEQARMIRYGILNGKKRTETATFVDASKSIARRLTK